MKSKLLSDLKKTLKAEAPSPRPTSRPAPTPPPEPEVSDEELFARATRGVQRIQAEPPPPPPTPLHRPDSQTLLRRAVAQGADDGPEQELSDTAALLNPLAAEATLEFARNGVQQGVIKKLKQAQPSWQAAVDLHGCTLDEAREAVGQLVHQAQGDGLQVIKIVHGKGTQSGHPLLKTCVNGWLKQLDAVLAFVSALPRDGGTGAVYVLLRRPARDPDAAKPKR